MMDRLTIVYLYELYREARIDEDLPIFPFPSLLPREQIAWGKFCRKLDREYQLFKFDRKPLRAPRIRP